MFVTITSGDTEVAAQYLQAFGDVEQAINAYMEEAPVRARNAHVARSLPRRQHMEYKELDREDDSDGPPPLESMPQQKVMRLLDTPVVTQIPFATSKSVFDPFGQFSNEGKHSGKKDQLAKLYCPPRKLFSGTTYEEVCTLVLVVSYNSTSVL